MTDRKLDAASRIEPLEIDVWVREVDRLRADVGHAREEDAIARFLRRAFHLVRLTPDPLWLLFGSRWDELEFERCLERGDVNRCLDNLINPGLEAALAKPDGVFEATVRAADLGVAGHSTAADHVTAFLRAWLDCILTVYGSLAESATFRDLDRHRSLSEPHRRSSEH